MAWIFAVLGAAGMFAGFVIMSGDQPGNIGAPIFMVSLIVLVGGAIVANRQGRQRE